jgi:2-oxoisovalerate dehydrogenase E2 component (dihydrolipoyl transacylase)
LKTHNIDVSHIKGTGKDQRILREDVLKYIENKDKPKITQA